MLLAASSMLPVDFSTTDEVSGLCGIPNGNDFLRVWILIVDKCIDL